jgi:hypothetical protein
MGRCRPEEHTRACEDLAHAFPTDGSASRITAAFLHPEPRRTFQRVQQIHRLPSRSLLTRGGPGHVQLTSPCRPCRACHPRNPLSVLNIGPSRNCSRFRCIGQGGHRVIAGSIGHGTARSVGRGRVVTRPAIPQDLRCYAGLAPLRLGAFPLGSGAFPGPERAGRGRARSSPAARRLRAGATQAQAHVPGSRLHCSGFGRAGRKRWSSSSRRPSSAGTARASGSIGALSPDAGPGGRGSRGSCES